jgi:hypothetical protein
MTSSLARCPVLASVEAKYYPAWNLIDEQTSLVNLTFSISAV